MKKALVFAAALAFGGVAMAQDTQPASTPSAAPSANRPTEPMPDSSTMAPPTDTPAPAPAPADMAPMTPDATATPDTPTPPADTTTTTSSTSTTTTDMTPPATTTTDTTTTQTTAPAPDAAPKTYPRCTRKITDNCTNAGGK